jgi:Putative phage tail protein
MDVLLYLGKFLLLTILSEYLRPRMQQDKPAAAGLKDLSFPTADQTRPHQWLIGRRLIDNPNLFGTFDFETQERTKRVRTGILRKENIVIGHDYFVSFAMVLCGGTGATLRRLYAGDRVVWEGDLTTGQTVPISIEWTEDGQPDLPRGFKGYLEFYSGPFANGQAPRSGYLRDRRGSDNVPTWKHLTYVVLRGIREASTIPPPASFVGTLLAGSMQRRGMWIGTSTRPEHLKFEVERMPSAASTGLGAPADAGSYWTVGTDSNPAYALAEVLTDPNYCAGIGSEELDIESFHRAAKVLKEEGHGTSQLWDSQRSSGEVALELCRQMGAVIQPDPLTGLHTLRLLRSTDEPVLVLNDDNIKVLSQFSQNSMDEATNSLALTYADKDEKFKQKPVEVLDDAAIEVAGRVIPGTASYAGITNATLANIIATRDLRSLSAPLATARVTAIVPKRQRFLPGDVVLLSSLKNGVTSLRMRVTSARYSKPGEALCELELIEDIFRSGEAVFSPPVPTPGSVSGIPDAAGWSQYNRLAPYPLTPAPEEPLMLFLAGAPAANPERATGYRLGYFDDETVRNSSTVAWSDSTYRFAARGYLQGTLAWAQTGQVAMTVTASDAYTISRNPGEVLALCGTELMRVSATASGTTATVTVIERGVYGTMPYGRSSGEELVLMYGYAIDSVPLVVSAPDPNYGGNTVVLRDSYVRAQTLSRGGVGPFDTIGDSGVVYADSQVAPNVLEPYGPGNVRAGGQVPAPAAEANWFYGDEWANALPQINSGDFSFTGRNRLRVDRWEGYTSGSGLEPGSIASVGISTRPWPEAGEYEPHGGFEGTNGGVTLPAGQRLVCASLQIVSPTGGTKKWAFYWRKTA